MDSESEAVFELYRRFLQELLARVLAAVDQGPSGPERVVRAVTAYWDASFEHRALRRRVLAAITSAEAEERAERLAQPFFLILRSELLGLGVADADALADRIYRGARSIALQETEDDRRDDPARRALLHGLQLPAA